MAYGSYASGSTSYGGSVNNVSAIIEKLLTESLIVSDAFNKTLSRVFSEAVELSDTLTKLKVIFKLLEESITVSDNLLRTISKSLTESIVLADTFTKMLSRVLSEALSLSDSLTVNKVVTKLLTEAITLTDSLLVKLNGIVVDIWTRTGLITSSWMGEDRISSIWTKIPKE